MHSFDVIIDVTVISDSLTLIKEAFPLLKDLKDFFAYSFSALSWCIIDVYHIYFSFNRLDELVNEVLYREKKGRGLNQRPGQICQLLYEQTLGSEKCVGRLFCLHAGSYIVTISS